MKVYIVEEGEFCEGAEVRGVFSTYEKALEYVNTYYCKPNWLQKDKDWWERGCNYVEIGEYEVE